MKIDSYSTQNDVILIMNSLFADVFIFENGSIFDKVIKVFKLKKEQFLSVNAEYEDYDTNLSPMSLENIQFEYVAYGLFFYEVALYIVKDIDYLEKMKRIFTFFFPSFENNEYKPDNRDSAEGFFWNIYCYLNRNQILSNIKIENNDSLKEELEKLFKVPDLNDEIMYQKYEKKQIKNYLSHFGLDGNIDTLVNNICLTAKNNLFTDDNNYNTQLFRFGYAYNEKVNIKEVAQVLKKTIQIEIKAFLKEKIHAVYEKDGIWLEKNQIMRLASIEDFDAFHQRVLRSCNLYFYAKEIAKVERIFVCEKLFGDSGITKKSEEQPIQELDEEVESLKHQIEKLQKENKGLKKELETKEKEYLSELRSIREENDKKFNLQQKKIKEMLRQNIGWALMFQVISLEEHEDDLLYPYKLEALQNKRVLVLGGRDEVRREFAKVIPQAIFIESETQKIPTGKIDCIFIFNRYFSHSLFYKYIRFARKNDIPVGYTPSTNMERILSDLFVAVKRIYELEIPDFILD